MKYLSVTSQLLALVAIVGLIAYAAHRASYRIVKGPDVASLAAAGSVPPSSGTPNTLPTSSSTTTATATSPAKKSPTAAPFIKPASSPTTPPVSAASSSPVDQITRVQNPYATAPESFATVNTRTRGALVNIFCAPKGGTLRPISGSGTIIDPRGVILTNAHVAQYVLLSESPQVDLSCYIRTGSPAAARWIPHVLYIPAVWVQGHATDINTAKPLGTGEHDYALLYITDSVDGSPLPASFPSVPVDTREAIGFLNDQVLAASYPAEFAGSSTNFSLYPVASVTNIAQLLTFTTNSVDVISVGSVIEAQSGSSGGAIVNAWGHLIGVITTTSEGATTADRDLRGITLSYVNRDITAQTGATLLNYLNGDLAAKTAAFTATQAPALYKPLLDQIIR